MTIGIPKVHPVSGVEDRRATALMLAEIHEWVHQMLTIEVGEWK